MFVVEHVFDILRVSDQSYPNGQTKTLEPCVENNINVYNNTQCRDITNNSEDPVQQYFTQDPPSNYVFYVIPQHNPC